MVGRENMIVNSGRGSLRTKGSPVSCNDEIGELLPKYRPASNPIEASGLTYRTWRYSGRLKGLPSLRRQARPGKFTPATREPSRLIQ